MPMRREEVAEAGRTAKKWKRIAAAASIAALTAGGVGVREQAFHVKRFERQVDGVSDRLTVLNSEAPSLDTLLRARHALGMAEALGKVKPQSGIGSKAARTQWRRLLKASKEVESVHYRAFISALQNRAAERRNR